LTETLTALGAAPVDGVLADLGVSRWQLTNPSRGFTFQEAAPLDMRMCRTDELTAADIVNRWPERDLADLIFQLGEERRARKLARAILRARPLRDNRHLAGVIEAAAPRQGKLHPATLTFQALRMAVNDEPAELDSLLAAAPGLIKPGGRFVVIAFHSLDDRKVKTAFRELVRRRLARSLTKHVVKPGGEEVRDNPPSRSAVLRALEIGARGGERQDGDDESDGHL
jgi:16S rRNA (cytosine1402-N4)-methyltransferase